MREIKFRGLDLRSGKWVYGYYVQTWGIGRIFDDDGFRCVDSETVGQYTGLEDSAGQGIYEGDILQDFNNDCYFKVVWDRGLFAIISIEPVPTMETLGDISTDGLEVIGNIHENPELLEEDDERD